MNRSGGSEHFFLVPDLGGNAFNLSLLNTMLAVGLSCVAFVMLKYIHSVPNLLRDFIIILLL